MKWIYRIITWVLIVGMLFSLTACDQDGDGATTAPTSQETIPTTQPSVPVVDGQIAWLLYGTWISKNGTVQSKAEKVELWISGIVPTEYEPQSRVEGTLDFVWPESMGYQYEGEQTYALGAAFADKHDNQHIYHGIGWLHDRGAVSFNFTICLEGEFLVLHIGDRYLVASKDPYAHPLEIFEFYKSYVRV